MVDVAPSDEALTKEVDTGEIHLASTLRGFLMLPNDPTVNLANTRFERATRTPDGEGSIRVDWGSNRTAVVEAWGPGGRWLLDRSDDMLGLTDDVSGFAPAEKPIREIWRRERNRRISRTGTLWHDLAWFIVQQRVTTVDASQQWNRLVSALGSPAPGPVELLVPPKPETVATMNYTDFHRFGIERRRAEHLRGAARIVTTGCSSCWSRTSRIAVALCSWPSPAVAAHHGPITGTPETRSATGRRPSGGTWLTGVMDEPVSDANDPDFSKKLFANLNRFVRPAVKAGLGSPLPIGLGAVVLESTGRVSGKPREVPLLGLRVGDRVVVSTVRAASQWVKNLEAEDSAAVWYCGRRREATATVRRGPLNIVELNSSKDQS